MLGSMHSLPDPPQHRPLWRRPFALLILPILLLAAVIAPVLIHLQYPEPRPERTAVDADWLLPSLPASNRRVLLLMIDGLAVEPFQRALDEGGMPNLSALLEDRPTRSMVAISSFPSATSPSVPQWLSGRYLDLDNLPMPPAVHAFDRETHELIRYVTQPDEWQWPVPTLFDALRGRPAVTVFEGRWDGPVSILTQYNMVGQALLEKIGASALSGGDSGPVETYLQLIDSVAAPVVSLVVLNEFDMTAHFHGPDSREARHALTRIDALIGRILQSLADTPSVPAGVDGGNRAPGPSDAEGHSLLDQTTILLFGDHGMAASGQFIDLPDFFSRQGLSAIDVSTISHVLLRERLGTLWTGWTDVILVAGGSNITQVYLRDRARGWSPGVGTKAGGSHAPDSLLRQRKLAEALTALDGVDQVMWRDGDDSVHVLARGAQEALIVTHGTGNRRRHAYLVGSADQPDPFRYLEHPPTRALSCVGPLVDHCFHSTTNWLDASAASDYPGAVALVTMAFKPARFAGNLMVNARRGYSFLRGQFGDHGNLDRAAMLTPLVLNGPGLSVCEESHQPRLVDIYPSVAILLGAGADDPAFAPLDGRILDAVACAAPRTLPQGPRSDSLPQN